MSKRLEDFIRNNRDAFDDKVPPGRVWDRLELSMNKDNHATRREIAGRVARWSVAAAALLLIASMFYYRYTDKPAKIPEAPVVKNEWQAVPEVSQMAKLISLRQEELKNLSRDQPVLYQRFSAAISRLDSSYKDLHEQFNETPNKEMLVEAMIQNLELQLNVLNQQLIIIKQIKESKKYSHEKSFPEM